ncbi:MAG: NAD(+) diphosphatase [Synergistaceae bacterium]|nr:NAD(+) diphosphatase [Synergistaceae bacterium]
MLIFCKNKILVRNNNYDFSEEYIKSHGDFTIIRSSKELPGNWQGLTSWLDVDEIKIFLDGEKLITLRDLWHVSGSKSFAMASGAWQFAVWFRETKFCSHCGGELITSSQDFGRLCKKCGAVFYAPISPAVITAVERDGKLLLANNTAWTDKRYSVIAGFVEPGESLEDAVRREIHEEVSISVKDIKYFGSQTWPFPKSLMLGFTAKYESGEVQPDGVEIADAGFFSPDEINNMNIPDKASIARKLIDNFLINH